MIPIAKLIRVIDESGNEHNPTYPKRAAGLVKHGRAHYVSDDTICLVCPPLTQETEEKTMTDMITVEQTTATADVVSHEQNTSSALSGISLQTAIKILKTIRSNIGENVYFWAAKNAYSGVYRTAVANGWIQDGLFVTDIPEGVDGGFLAADMRRVALMAELLVNVLEDNLPSAPTPVGGVSAEEIHALVDARVGEYLASLDLETLRDTLEETREELAETLEELKEEALEAIEVAKDDAIAELEDFT